MEHECKINDSYIPQFRYYRNVGHHVTVLVAFFKLTLHFSQVKRHRIKKYTQAFNYEVISKLKNYKPLAAASGRYTVFLPLAFSITIAQKALSFYEYKTFSPSDNEPLRHFVNRNNSGLSKNVKKSIVMRHRSSYPITWTIVTILKNGILLSWNLLTRLV